MQSRLIFSFLEYGNFKKVFRIRESSLWRPASTIRRPLCFLDFGQSSFTQWSQHISTLSYPQKNLSPGETTLGKRSRVRVEGNNRISMMYQIGRLSDRWEEDFVLADRLQRLEVNVQDDRLPSENILTDYLSLPELSLRMRYWNDMKTKVSMDSLPTVLVHFMHLSSIHTVYWTPLDITLFATANNTLASNGLKLADVEDWAHIVSAETGDAMASRISESCYRIQDFVLLQALNLNLQSVRSLEILILSVWDLILGESQCLRRHGRLSHDVQQINLGKHHVPLENYSDDQLSQVRQNPYPSNQCSQDKMKGIDFEIFMRIAFKLTRQARRLWPSSLDAIALLISSFAEDFVKRANCDPQNITPPISRLLCHLINTFMEHFSRPSDAEPYLQIRNNWNAQKTLMKLAARFKPALILNHNSYRAIVRTFAAHKKTPLEVRTMSRRSRSWPPWIEPPDAMHAEISAEDQHTRVVAGIARLKEAGYGGEWFDDALKVIGGQEFDGTPTIQTRRTLASPWKSFMDMNEVDTEMEDLHPSTWAARIIATRDVQEAWLAFKKFRKLGGMPNQDTYLAMFEKLTYNAKQEARKPRFPVVPGDGLEVLPVPENNFSDYYRRYLNPPSLDDLYLDMLRCDITPQGNCLSFLVRNARTPDDGLQYLRDSGLNDNILEFLGASSRSSQMKNIIPEIPQRILADFLHLICRFIPRAVKVSCGTESTEEQTKWIIVQLESPSCFGIQLNYPLHQAAHLLNSQKPTSLPPWYSFFRVLSLHNTIISQELAGDPRNDLLAWKVLKSSFEDFTNCGLHLNPSGFLIICHGFCKYILATFKVNGEHQKDIDEACQLLKAEFTKLTKTSLGQNGLPKLYHNIRGVHLHAYVRCLALVLDYPSIVSMIDWIMKHARELDEISQQESTRGQRRFLHVFTAARICCEGTHFESYIRVLIESSPFWDGWPTDEDVTDYKNHRSRWAHLPES